MKLRFEKDKPAAKLIHANTALAEEKLHNDENEDVGQETAADTVKTASAVSREISLKRSHDIQKSNIKKQYEKNIRHSGELAESFGTTVEKAVKKGEKAANYIREHQKGFLLIIAIFLILSLLLNSLSSCTLMAETIGSSIAGSTYPSRDKDMLAAEAEYSAMEGKLKKKLDDYETDHDYDEYEYDLDEIKHDPYVLISAITALHGGEWTIDQVHGTISTLFNRQYTLSESLETENGTGPDPYYKCKVELKNNDLSRIPSELMGEEQLGWYAIYMATLGNRPDLFPGSAYIGRYGEGSYLVYDIPPEALEDEVFAAMIEEAEKYLGYPYVWGGSSPATSFDCSGFVCWVINHSGWNIGRTTAQGLCNFCTPVSAANARPGDLVFFIGTYDTPEVSHVGIYVGNNMMLHCGDPISYSNLNSNYWQAHLYTFGRLP